ncbi:phospholipase [Rathayibacter sp. KR2-224]|uniref:aggregation-promoting factor C-terminal-like domain-containing protein n=1 Tax=Rathayibacter sp. KR2-224 TaxID=3400913 RepID=UPI003C02BA7D
MTFLTRISPANLKNTLRALSDRNGRHRAAGKITRHKRPLLFGATAVAAVAIAAVATSVVVPNAYAEPAKQLAAAAADITAAGPLTDAVKASSVSATSVVPKAAKASFDALAVAQITQEQVQGRADVTDLGKAISALQNNYSSNPGTLHKLTVAAQAAVKNADAAAAAHDAAVVAAQKAAQLAAQEAAAKAAAEAQAAAEALSRVNTPDGARTVAQSMMASKYGWGSDQFQCLNSLWNRESGWNYQSYNAGSGATGIPQALPGSKMASFGSDWATNAATQIAWGLDYISRGYGTPCAAWGHSESSGWY